MNKKTNIMNNSYLLTNSNILLENIQNIATSLSPNTYIIPVLKDNFYGLGAVPAAKIYEPLPFVKCFAVAHLTEALALRESGIKKDIFILGNILPFQIHTAVENDITMTIGRTGLVSEIADICKKSGKTAKIQIKIDTGLHRIGLEPGSDLDSFVDEFKQNSHWIIVSGVFSHFADLGDVPRVESQYALFEKSLKTLEDAGIDIPLKHISGSEASELFPQYNLQAIRLGRRLIMDHPTKPLGNIKEVVSWRTYITNIKGRKKGDNLGYGGKFKLERDCTVATIGIGYGDGLNLDLVGIHAPVLIDGVRCPLLACCMDQALVDVTGINCRVGDEVTLFGYDGKGGYLSSQELALMIGDYEGCGLTSAISYRTARLFD